LKGLNPKDGDGGPDISRDHGELLRLVEGDDADDSVSDDTTEGASSAMADGRDDQISVVSDRVGDSIPKSSILSRIWNCWMISVRELS
jgi:hypothetical protein